jgi:hypothetical protein
MAQAVDQAAALVGMQIRNDLAAAELQVKVMPGDHQILMKTTAVAAVALVQ